ncbi:Clr5 domain-containing protein [Hypoxylon sp. NC1633]|nr:Clr5 domain-containing protein [Hypoxylon sp. NC1633]
MAKVQKTASKGRTVRKAIAGRIHNSTWDVHKDILHRWYIDENMPLPDVMKKMKKEHGFKPTTKQCRYRFQKWKWPKYNNGLKQSRGPGADLSSDLNENGSVGSATTDSEDGGGRAYSDSTPPSSFDGDSIESTDVHLLRKHFLSVFSSVSYPIPPDDYATAETLSRNPANVAWSEIDVHGLTTKLNVPSSSIDVVAYHRLNFVLEELSKGKQVCMDDEPAIVRLKVFEQQLWYTNFDENGPAARCLWSCFDWVKRMLLCCPPKDPALSCFDDLGDWDAAREPHSASQVALLFTYLFNIWISQGAHSSGDDWVQRCKQALGISATETLRIVSAMILYTATEDEVGSTSNSRDVHTVLKNALSGVNAIEAAHGTTSKRKLVTDFITEFVWTHDPNSPADEVGIFAEKSSSAAIAYADKKLPVGFGHSYNCSIAPDGAETSDEESESSEEDCIWLET